MLFTTEQRSHSSRPYDEDVIPLPVQPTTSAPLDVDDTAFVTCPLCHTADASLTERALGAGGNWQCTTCHQNWTASRLATSAAYAVWAAEHDRART